MVDAGAERLPERNMPEPENARARFAVEAENAFSCLTAMGFRVARREPLFVRFERQHVFVDVAWERLSYWVDLELGRTDRNERYSLHELATAVAPRKADTARCQSTDLEVVVRSLSEFAELLELHCVALLEGKEDAFQEVSAKVAPRRRALTLEATFGARLSAADCAWDAKDFDRARALYEGAEEGLDETQRGRMNYLRSKQRR